MNATMDTNMDMDTQKKNTWKGHTTGRYMARTLLELACLICVLLHRVSDRDWNTKWASRGIDLNALLCSTLSIIEVEIEIAVDIGIDVDIAILLRSTVLQEPTSALEIAKHGWLGYAIYRQGTYSS